MSKNPRFRFTSGDPDPSSTDAKDRRYTIEYKYFDVPPRRKGLEKIFWEEAKKHPELTPQAIMARAKKRWHAIIDPTMKQA